MGKYIKTFERYSQRKKKNKKIWDKLLEIKPRTFKSVKADPEPENSPELAIPSPLEWA